MSAQPDIPLELTTDRLALRALHPDQAEEILAGIHASFLNLHRWMAWATEIPTLEWQREHLVALRAKHLAGESLSFSLFLREGGAFVGNCGIPRLDWDERRFEIGYWCHEAHEGEGYVSEAVRALTDLAFGSFRAQRVELRMSELNRKSWRVAERCEFTLEETLLNDGCHPDGSARNTRVYVKLSDPR
ncbi:MAG: GNAT family N-acetyltransferase [bacterium]|nr:GNAT family N-acetyltransferase [bacterium]